MTVLSLFLFCFFAAKAQAQGPKTIFFSGLFGPRYLEVTQTSQTQGPQGKISTWTILHAGMLVEIVPPNLGVIFNLSEHFASGRGGDGARFVFNDLEGETRFPLFRASENFLFLGAAGIRWLLLPVFANSPAGGAEPKTRGFWLVQLGPGFFHRFGSQTISLYAKAGKAIWSSIGVAKSFALEIQAQWTLPISSRWSLALSPGFSSQRYDFSAPDTALFTNRGSIHYRQWWMMTGLNTSW